MHVNLSPKTHHYHPGLHLQRDAFLDYVPTHRQGVTFIVLTTSINAVMYNLVRATTYPTLSWDLA